MLSILRKARLKDKEMRILMLGLDNAGKTTIVKQIMKEDVTTVSPTLGFIIKTIDFEGYRLNGTSEGRKHSVHIGKTTLKRQIL
jgi:ADP-ribosylation factor-like protein 2